MLKLLCSSVGKKYLMGVTGLIWLGFIFGHMAGNFLMFVSADAYNEYGHTLTSGKLIYLIEAVLVLALLIHVSLAIHLTISNRSSKGTRYAVTPPVEKGGSWASRTMALHGTIVLFFIISHLLTFKFGTYYETTVNGVVMRDLFRLMVEEFSKPYVLAWYIVGLILLFFHVTHGAKSVFQSFGLLHPSYQGLIQKISWIYGFVVIGGFLAQPIYVFLFKAG